MSADRTPLSDSSAEGSPRLAAMSVLLVEDSPADSRLLQEELREVIEAGEVALMVVRTLADALQELRRFEFSCVLLDLGLPDGRGVANVEALRAVDRHVAVVVLTGLDSDASAQAALQLGAQDYVIKGQHDSVQLMQRVRHSVQRNKQVTELEDQHRKRFHNASRDPLTGLANRLLFDDRARQTLAHAHRGGQGFAVCYLDLDRFKSVNDTLGHAAGDDVLRRVSEILADTVRESDTVARIGGDEFAILIVPADDDIDPAITARRVYDRLVTIREVGDAPVRVGFSIGIARYPDHGATLDGLMQNADSAMYGAKRAGGGVLVYSNDTLTPARATNLVTPASSGADTDGFTLYYQPWVDAAQRRFAGLEVHTAWHQNGQVPAVPVFDSVESPPNVVQAGEKILRTACAQWSQWREQGFDPGMLSLNLAAAQLTDEQFPAFLLAHTGAVGLQPYSVRLEVAATAIGSLDDGPNIQGIRRLRDRGFQVIVDSFAPDGGTLRALAITPLDGMKLDAAFAHRVVDEGVAGTAHRFLIATLGAANALSLPVIVQGVDSAETGFAFRNAGCRYMQGALLGAPLISSEVPRHWQMGPQGLDIR